MKSKHLHLFYTKYKMKIQYIWFFCVEWLRGCVSFDKIAFTSMHLQKKYNLGHDERYNYIYNNTVVEQQISMKKIYKYDSYQKLLKTFLWMQDSHSVKNIHHSIPREIQPEMGQDMDDFLQESAIIQNHSINRFQIKHGGLLSNSDWCEKDDW